MDVDNVCDAVGDPVCVCGSVGLCDPVRVWTVCDAISGPCSCVSHTVAGCVTARGPALQAAGVSGGPRAGGGPGGAPSAAAARAGGGAPAAAAHADLAERLGRWGRAETARPGRGRRQGGRSGTVSSGDSGTGGRGPR